MNDISKNQKTPVDQRNTMLFAQYAQLEAGDVYEDNLGFHTIEPGSDLLDTTTQEQGYYRFRIVGGPKWESFMNNRDSAEWGDSRRCYHWVKHIPIKACYITMITVNDPDRKRDVELEVWQDNNGRVFALSADFMANSTENVYSPFTGEHIPEMDIAQGDISLEQ